MSENPFNSSCIHIPIESVQQRGKPRWSHCSFLFFSHAKAQKVYRKTPSNILSWYVGTKLPCTRFFTPQKQRICQGWMHSSIWHAKSFYAHQVLLGRNHQVLFVHLEQLDCSLVAARAKFSMPMSLQKPRFQCGELHTPVAHLLVRLHRPTRILNRIRHLGARQSFTLIALRPR